jgi:hypothetical protein
MAFPLVFYGAKHERGVNAPPLLSIHFQSDVFLSWMRGGGFKRRS